jgi:hypothetical protein
VPLASGPGSRPAKHKPKPHKEQLDMRRIKLLGLALMAVFAFGIVVAASASAEEKEPAGILCLGGIVCPTVVFKAAKQATVTKLLIDNLTQIECKEISSTTTFPEKENLTHLTLGEIEIDYEKCKRGEVGCRSENIAGVKDPAETILQVGIDTDVHTISLLNGAKLLAGLLIGLLELVEGAKKLDLTINCGGVKILVLGAVHLDVLKAEPTKDVKEVEITTTALTCDTADTLCKLELDKWAATAFDPLTKVEQKCDLAAFVKALEECAVIDIGTPIKATVKPEVEIDF